MTSKRDLEQRLAGLRAGEDDEADAGDSLDIEINRYLVISRERAEREGREILGEADTPGEREHVRVVPSRSLSPLGECESESESEDGGET